MSFHLCRPLLIGNFPRTDLLPDVKPRIKQGMIKVHCKGGRPNNFLGYRRNMRGKSAKKTQKKCLEKALLLKPFSIMSPPP